MRFAELSSRASLIVALCAGAAGCASLADFMPGPSHRPDPTQVKTPAPAGASADAKAQPSAPAAITVESGPSVSPAAQSAFDDARRALGAGRTQEAERAFRALTRSNPELGGPHANLGLIYQRAGKFEEAVTELELAVLSSPHQPQYLNQLGIAYRQQGQFAKARDAYERAIAIDPNYAAPTLNLGILYDLYLWDGQRALELYDRYLALSPGGDAQVSKWITDLKNRKQQQATLNRKEQE